MENKEFEYNAPLLKEALAEKGINLDEQLCTVCKSVGFTFQSALGMIIMANEGLFSPFKQKYVPTGILSCVKCGHIELYDLAVLGLIDPSNTDSNELKSS